MKLEKSQIMGLIAAVAILFISLIFVYIKYIDMIKVCSHTSHDRCNCRKPNPGMLIEASEELGIDLSESYMIGDRWGDIEAGQRSGCKSSFFIDYGYTEKQPTGDFILVKSLRECADIILKNFKPITIERKNET